MLESRTRSPPRQKRGIKGTALRRAVGREESDTIYVYPCRVFECLPPDLWGSTVQYVYKVYEPWESYYKKSHDTSTSLWVLLWVGTFLTCMRTPCRHLVAWLQSLGRKQKKPNLKVTCHRPCMVDKALKPLADVHIGAFFTDVGTNYLKRGHSRQTSLWKAKFTDKWQGLTYYYYVTTSNFKTINQLIEHNWFLVNSGALVRSWNTKSWMK